MSDKKPGGIKYLLIKIAYILLYDACMLLIILLLLIQLNLNALYVII